MAKTTDFYGIRAKSAVEAFSIAAANSQFDAMRSLLGDNVDIDGIGSNGGTALHEAAFLGLIRSVDFLIRAGAGLNLTDSNDLTPLMNACSKGKVTGSRVALRLIEAGADVRYVRKDDEMTAIKFAAKSCTPDVIQSLVDHGAEVDGPSGTCQTALMLAARANHVEALKVLIRNGANPSLPCGLPWAKKRTAEGLAELERQRKALEYLREVRTKSEVEKGHH